MKRMSVVIAVCLAVFVVFAAGTLFSQDAETMKLVRDKIRIDKKLLIASNMELTETEGKAFWPIYDTYQDDLAKLSVRGLKLLEDYAKNYQVMTNDIAKKILDEQMAIESEKLKLRQTYLPTFRKALSDIKVARYYQLENKIQAVVNYELADMIPLVK
ncbi:MAG: hypothetical protein NTX75_13600 [Proteobacteria bacterium]|nr:hypothetical protein [Pseudomonadota bacterium]